MLRGSGVKSQQLTLLRSARYWAAKPPVNVGVRRSIMMLIRKTFIPLLVKDCVRVKHYSLLGPGTKTYSEGSGVWPDIVGVLDTRNVLLAEFRTTLIDTEKLQLRDALSDAGRRRRSKSCQASGGKCVLRETHIGDVKYVQEEVKAWNERGDAGQIPKHSTDEEKEGYLKAYGKQQ
jgi:hypothetical protein